MLMKERRKGYTKKPKGVKTVKFFTDVPVSLIPKLDQIAMLENKSKTQALEDLIREAYAVEYNVNPISHIDAVGALNEKQNDFVKDYIMKHFGENPSDVVFAQSEALDAYWKSEGLDFGDGEDTFILPKS